MRILLKYILTYKLNLISYFPSLLLIRNMIAKVNERKLKAIRLVTSVQNCLQNEWTLISSNNYEYIPIRLW